MAGYLKSSELVEKKHPIVPNTKEQLKYCKTNILCQVSYLPAKSFPIKTTISAPGGFVSKGLLCLDEYFKKDFVGYRENVEAVLGNKNLTLWLEYFAGAVVTQLEKTLTEVLSEKYSLDVTRNFFELNDRQKEIMSILDQPNVVISNKKVQKMFKVSQITASRDLSRLSTLGLLFTHGKGRSVYYTKI